MGVLLVVWEWLRGQSPKHLAYGAALLAAVLSFIFFTHHERAIGEERCQAAVTAANARAQVIADRAAKDANAKIDAARAKTEAALPDLLHIYQDRTRPSDCVPYIRPGGNKR